MTDFENNDDIKENNNPHKLYIEDDNWIDYYLNDLDHAIVQYFKIEIIQVKDVRESVENWKDAFFSFCFILDKYGCPIYRTISKNDSEQIALYLKLETTKHDYQYFEIMQNIARYFGLHDEEVIVEGEGLAEQLYKGGIFDLEDADVLHELLDKFNKVKEKKEKDNDRLDPEMILEMVNPYLTENQLISKEDFDMLFEDMESKDITEIESILTINNISISTEIYNKYKEQFEGQLPNYYLTLENEMLCVMAQNGDKNATTAMIIKNERFVYKQIKSVKYYLNTSSVYDEDDMMQAGYMGLLKGIEHFDAERGNKFLTYAGYWIIQYMMRDLLNNGYTIRIPIHFLEKMAQINKIQSKYQSNDLTIDELTKKLNAETNHNYNVNEVEHAIVIRNQVYNLSYLDTFIGEEEDSRLGDYIPDDTANVEDIVEKKILNETINEILNEFTEKEKNVIVLRFGLNNEEEKTLEQIGDKYGVTRERIRQIELKVLKKLRQPRKKSKLYKFYEE